MSTEDLSRTLEIDDSEFKILLELEVTNAATNRALAELLIQHLTSGDDALLQKTIKEFDLLMSIQRGKVIDRLFLRFGHLPKDIFD